MKHRLLLFAFLAAGVAITLVFAMNRLYGPTADAPKEEKARGDASGNLAASNSVGPRTIVPVDEQSAVGGNEAASSTKEGGLHVRVWVKDSDGLPLESARVHADLWDGERISGTSDAGGQVQITLAPESTALMAITVLAPRFAVFQRYCYDRREEIREQGRLEIVAQLRRGGTAEIQVMDEAGRPLASHWVELSYAGRDTVGDHFDEEPVDAKLNWDLLTQADGLIRASYLEPGHWRIRCSAWKRYLGSFVVTVYLDGHTSERVSLQVARADPSTFASGVVSLPDDAVELDDGTIDNYKIQRGDNLGRLPMYWGGEFFLRDGTWDALDIRLVDSDGNARGPWQRVFRGIHGIELLADIDRDGTKSNKH